MVYREPSANPLIDDDLKVKELKVTDSVLTSGKVT
jgi:hypothetical protein